VAVVAGAISWLARDAMATKRLSPRETAAVVRRLEAERPRAGAFGFVSPSADVHYAFHAHGRHQLIVPRSGVVTVESERRLLVASAGHAVWIPAGRRHATALRGALKASVYFDRRAFPAIADDVRLFAVPEVVGAMAEHAALAPATAAPDATFFVALRALCVEALRAGEGPALPRPRAPGLLRASEALLARLDAPADFAAAARAAGMSARNLRRAFRAETGLSLSAFLRRARMLWAMQMLAAPAPKSVLEVALATGFGSPSAFTAAFRRCFGKRPREVRVARAARATGRE